MIYFDNAATTLHKPEAVKKAVGSLRLDLAQYREMEVFMQFASDLDELTRKQLFYGQGLMRLLRQPQSKPYSQAQEVILLVTAMGKKFVDVPVDKVNETASEMLEYFAVNAPGLYSELESAQELTQDLRERILLTADKFRSAKA